MHRTEEGNLVLQVKIRSRQSQQHRGSNNNRSNNKISSFNKQQPGSKNEQTWLENVTVMDKYVNSYLISDYIPNGNDSEEDETSKSHFVLINRLGKVKSKFGWTNRVKIKFRIRQSNGDVDPDLFLVKFSGGNFGILKVSKQVLIKKFKIEELDKHDDSFWRKRMGVVMGY